MFIGEYHHSLDAKNRIIIPSKFREQLVDTFILTLAIDNCLAIYAKKQFEDLVNKIAKLPSAAKNVRKYMHLITAKANEVSLDKMGRIQLPNLLKENVGIIKDCAIIGVNDHIEIWDKDKWLNYFNESSENFEDIVESLVDYDEAS